MTLRITLPAAFFRALAANYFGPLLPEDACPTEITLTRGLARVRIVPGQALDMDKETEPWGTN